LEEFPVMIAGTLMLIFVCGLVGADEPSKNVEKQELEKLQGTWSIDSSEIRGRQRVRDEHNRDDRAVIAGDKLTAMRGGKASHTSTLRIDPSKSPRQMDTIFVRPDGNASVALGIYELEGDKLTVCSATAGSDRPERFESTEKTTLTVLKRADP
jgi:uncharacterized protein (TIGR03067 family)